MPPDDIGPEFNRPSSAKSAHSIRLLQRYEALAEVSRCMLDAARQNDWSLVERLESRCTDLINELKQAGYPDALSSEEQRQRIAFLRRILADDAEIRARSEPWLEQLETLVPRAPHAFRAGTGRGAGGRKNE